MQAKITKQAGYMCSPNGATIAVFPCGAIVTGQVAEWAIADGAASRMFDPRDGAKVVTAPESKRGRKK